jgi:hypothetical protein
MDKLTGKGTGNPTQYPTKYAFVRELITLMGVNKSGLKVLYDKIYDRLFAYEKTELTPKEIIELNDFSHSQCEILLTENATLTKALELAISNHTVNPESIDRLMKYYIQQAQEAINAKA